MMRLFLGTLACLAALLAEGRLGAAETSSSSEPVQRLVERLDAADVADRNAAEKELIALGLKEKSTAAGEAFIDLLPKLNDEMAQETQVRLTRIAGEIRSYFAKQALEATLLNLDVVDAPLADVLTEIEKQTGNRLTDYREQFGQETGAKKITYQAKDQLFWIALDAMLDAVQMSPYPFSGEETLALIDREPGILRRSDRATYSGPFRIEAIGASSQRGIRSPGQSGLSLDLEISWEPRLKPIALIQLAADLRVVCDDGRQTPVVTGEQAFNVEVQPGSHAADVTISLQLPARTAKQLAVVEGRMTALAPGRVVDLKFNDLSAAKDLTQRAGEVVVTVDRVVRNQALWEVHMRIAVDGNEPTIDVQSGWVYQNLAYLVDKRGERIDNAGFETTVQTADEVGFAYFYELPEGREINDYAWVYRTPASIIAVPVEFKLEEVPLP